MNKYFLSPEPTGTVSPRFVLLQLYGPVLATKAPWEPMEHADPVVARGKPMRPEAHGAPYGPMGSMGSGVCGENSSGRRWILGRQSLESGGPNLFATFLGWM